MGDHRLKVLRIDGERIPFRDARLRTADGLESATWDIVLDGARVLRLDEKRRVELTLVTEYGDTLEGEAMVASPGHRERDTDVYDGIELTGTSALERW